MAPAHESDAQRLAALRELLPATAAGIYLDTATAGPLPAETAAAMREADEWELRVGRAGAGREEDVAQREDEARAVVAALIGGDPARVALAPSAGQALASGLATLGLGAGDVVVVSPLNDAAVVAAAAGHCTTAGAHLHTSWLIGADLPAGTRAIVLPHVAPTTGALVDVSGLRASLPAGEVHIAVDLGQSAGAIPIEIETLGADLAVFATDRWALAPEGTAALWLAPPRSLGDQPRLPRTTLLGLARSIGWLEMYVGLEWALERGLRLARQLADRLAGVDGVKLLTPPDAMAAIVAFRLPPPWTAEEVADELGRRVFAIVRPLPELNAVRASVAWFNTNEELERFVGAVAELAQHTPQTLPRRQSLTVL